MPGLEARTGREAGARGAPRGRGLDPAAPLENLLGTVEDDAAVPVLIARLDGGIAGCCVRTGAWAMVFVNGEHALARQRFTLAHEYGHVYCAHATSIDTLWCWPVARATRARCRRTRSPPSSSPARGRRAAGRRRRAEPRDRRADRRALRHLGDRGAQPAEHAAAHRPLRAAEGRDRGRRPPPRLGLPRPGGARRRPGARRRRAAAPLAGAARDRARRDAARRRSRRRPARAAPSARASSPASRPDRRRTAGRARPSAAARASAPPRPAPRTPPRARRRCGPRRGTSADRPRGPRLQRAGIGQLAPAHAKRSAERVKQPPRDARGVRSPRSSRSR